MSAFAEKCVKRGCIVLIEPPPRNGDKVKNKINLSLETRKKLRIIFFSSYTCKVTYASRPRWIAVAGCSLVDERLFFFFPQKTCTVEYLIKMIWYARWKNKLFIVLLFFFFYFSLYEYRYIRARVLRYLGASAERFGIISRFTQEQTYTHTHLHTHIHTRRGEDPFITSRRVDDTECAVVVSPFRRKRKRESARERELTYPAMGSLHVWRRVLRHETIDRHCAASIGPWRPAGRQRVAPSGNAPYRRRERDVARMNASDS